MSTPAPVPYTKRWISVDDQLKLLVERGLVISDLEQARKKLWRVHYYRFSAYLRPFRQTGTESFIKGTTFERVLQIYEFDRRLRLTVLDAIERIEIAVRARIVNHFSSKHGPFGHRDANNFERYFRLAQWLAELDEDVEKSREEFLAHYQSKYAGYPAVPLWMATAELVWVDRTFAVLLVIRSMLRSLHLGDDWKSGIESDFASEFSDPFIVKGLGMNLDWKDHPVWKG